MEYSKSWQAVALHLTTTTMTTIAVMTYVHATVGAESTLRDSLAASTTTFPRGNSEPFDGRRVNGEHCINCFVALLNAMTRSLLLSMANAVGARIVVFNATTDIIVAETWLKRALGNMGEPIKLESELLRVGYRPDPGLPWFGNSEGPTSSLRSPKFIQSAPADSYLGWWTLPYISCKTRQWLISYSVYVRPSDMRHGIRDFLSIDIDISGLEVNQCDDDILEKYLDEKRMDNHIETFRGSHKCHDTTQVNMTELNKIFISFNFNYFLNLSRVVGRELSLLTRRDEKSRMKIVEKFLVSLTYRVKSAHKVKLTDKQLLQWMVPVLLVMLIYLGTWTLSAPPDAKVIADGQGLEFYQCEYNWWDHSLAIGEILFLAWGIRVCYNVRNAESLFNEARLISYAIYNIAVVNTTMIAIHLFIFPHAGPDMKYALGFLRTQLSTSVTIFLVFGPKVLRVLRGQGDQWDSRARARGITASFSLNGIRGLVAEETTDLYQENEELKEEIQKLAAQIEFMKIVHMEMHNRHIKPKLGGYFSTHGHGWGAQSPNAKTTSASFIIKVCIHNYHLIS
ncbi:probable G-protein coupled receptor CG31760 [Fopius arisanus]|uniref:Probable G-protein coupled receptor CG31760 n=1 Tax=Fopius arisanus TaxID=64838 RepID=A0A9R1T1H9_9HYME|nr:PREDICTED: probable G-protein coupled receptor CG31760 [Fopius arisanus]